MQPITYQVDHQRAGTRLDEQANRTQRLLGMVQWTFILLAVALGSLVFILDNLFLRILAGLVSLFLAWGHGMLLAAWHLKPKGDTADYTLTLDDQGLAFHQWGERLRLGWPEVSSFALDRGYITFRVPRRLNVHRGFTWFSRWVLRALDRNPMVDIEDIYDAPLDEIAAKLNEYRERALAGAPDRA